MGSLRRESGERREQQTVNRWKDEEVKSAQGMN